MAGKKFTFNEIVEMVASYVDRQACINDSSCTPSFDIDEEAIYMEISKQDLADLENATEDGGEFRHVKAFLGLENVNDKEVQTFILVPFDENGKAMSMGDDTNGNKYYGLERWKPRKKIVDSISPLTLDNERKVDDYLDNLFF